MIQITKKETGRQINTHTECTEDRSMKTKTDRQTHRVYITQEHEDEDRQTDRQTDRQSVQNTRSVKTKTDRQSVQNTGA